jgi:hypothetical protein
MLNESTPPPVIASRDIRGFFYEALDSTLQKRGVDTAPQTVSYLSGVLADFSRTERFYEKTEEGLKQPVLAGIYGKAIQATTPDERLAHMRRLGDVALFLSGMFAESFNRKLVDVDYCIAMGEGAYAWLSDAPLVSAPARNDRGVFAELADKFAQIVDVLNEIGEHAPGRGNQDLLRLYEVWLKTGSTRAAERLREHGIEVNAVGTSAAFH